MADSLETAAIAGVVSIAVAGLSNFVAEAYRRHRDACSLAAGLAGDLMALREISHRKDVKEQWRRTEKRTSNGELFPIPEFPIEPLTFFDSNAGHLGRLDANLVRDVTFVYGHVKAYRVLINMLGKVTTAEQQGALLRSALEVLEVAEKRADPLIEALVKRSKQRFRPSWRP